MDNFINLLWSEDAEIIDELCIRLYNYMQSPMIICVYCILSISVGINIANASLICIMIIDNLYFE